MLRSMTTFYLLVASGESYVDLSAAAIVETEEQVRVFANCQTPAPRPGAPALICSSGSGPSEPQRRWSRHMVRTSSC